MPESSAAALLQPVYREFLQVEIARPATIPLHQHHDYELIRAVRGRYCCELNQVPLALRPGQALLVKPGDRHRDVFRRAPVFYQALSFYVETADSGRPAALFVASLPPQRQILTLPARQLRGYFARFLREAAQPDEFSAPLSQAILSELFWSLARSVPAEIRGPQLAAQENGAARFTAALRQIFARCKRQSEVDVEALAAGLHMSRRNLTRLCRQHLGLSPARAFLHYRIRAAAGLLRQTRMNCKEVALYLGFCNPYHFSVTFKRVTGLAPQAYKDGADPHGPRLTVWPE